MLYFVKTLYQTRVHTARSFYPGSYPAIRDRPSQNATLGLGYFVGFLLLQPVQAVSGCCSSFKEQHAEYCFFEMRLYQNWEAERGVDRQLDIHRVDRAVAVNVAVVTSVDPQHVVDNELDVNRIYTAVAVDIARLRSRS